MGIATGERIFVTEIRPEETAAAKEQEIRPTETAADEGQEIRSENMAEMADDSLTQEIKKTNDELYKEENREPD